MPESIFQGLLDYTKHRYDSSLRVMLDIGDDINIDDVYELMKTIHEQLKELLHLLSLEKINHAKTE